MPKEEVIELTQNYRNLFNRFLSDAMLYMNRFASPYNKTFTRKEVYGFVASFRIALGSVTKEADLIELRTQFDSAADVMFDQLMKEQWDD